MIAPTREIKKKGRDKEVFGEDAYLATQPGKGAQQHEKQAWEKKVKFSRTVVMNTGSAKFNGLGNPDVEVDMEIFAEANDGSGTYAPEPAGKTTIRQLLTKMKGKDGKQFWQSLYQGWDGTWTGSFIGKGKNTLDKAGEVSMCLASHFRILLARRGFTKKCIFKLIYTSFDDLRVDSAQNVKWDKKQKN